MLLALLMLVTLLPAQVFAEETAEDAEPAAVSEPVPFEEPAAEPEELIAEPEEPAEEVGELTPEEPELSAAAQGECGKTVTWVLDSEGTLTVSGEGAMYDYASKDFNGLKATSAPWRDYIDSVYSLVIEPGVTAIGSYAFYGCRCLTSVSIPESVTSIGQSAFLNVPWLASLGDYAVVNGTLLAYQGTDTDIVIPDGVRCIHHSSFYKRSEIETVVMPNSVEEIEASAFYGCSALREITLSAGLKYVGDYAFNDCIALENVYYNGDVSSWAKISFGNSASITYSNPMDHAGHIFIDGKPVTSIVIPEGTEAINNDSFRNWTDAESLTIPEGVKSIGANAFLGCGKLAAVSLPVSLEAVGALAFSGCGAITSFSYAGSFEQWALVSVGNGNEQVDGNLFINGERCPILGSCGERLKCMLDASGSLFIAGQGAIRAYDLPWSSCRASVNAVVIGSGVTAISYQAFSNLTNMKTVSVPDTVTVIERLAFYGCGSLESIDLPDGITYIANETFYNCGSLKSIVIPDGVTYIDSMAFYNCVSLESVHIPDSVAAIGSQAFAGCACLVSVTGLNGLKEISEDAFSKTPWYASLGDFKIISNILIDYVGSDGNISVPYGVQIVRERAFSGKAVVSVELPEGVTVIGASAFSNCGSLESIKLPSGLTEIGDSAFYNCAKLESIEIPGSVTKIGSGIFTKAGLKRLIIGEGMTAIPDAGLFYGAFENTSAEEVVLPSTLTYIGSKAFRQSRVKEIVITNSVRAIGDEAFAECTNIKSLTFENGIKTIGKKAFYHCKGIQSIALPDSLTELGSDAFSVCTDLETVTFGKGLKTISSGAFSNCRKLAVPIIPENIETIDSNAFAQCSAFETVRIPDTVKTLSGAFSNCTNLKSVHVGSGITSLGSNTFYRCSALEEVELPEGLTSIGSGAFEECTSLKALDIPDAVNSIGDRAFYKCSSLTDIAIPKTVTSIGNKAFCACTQLTSVYIPKDVVSIGSNAFSNCTALRNVTGLEKVTTINSEAFSGCTALVSVDVPQKLTLLGTSAFINCELLEGFELPSGISEIGPYAFSGCYSLTEMTIPSGISSIAEGVFNECVSLYKVSLPDGLTSIGASAFASCISLYEIELPQSLTTIGETAFIGCVSLMSIFIPANVTFVDKGAFSYCYSMMSIEADSANINYYSAGNCLITRKGGKIVSGCCNSVIPTDGSITEIGPYSFYGCGTLLGLCIPEGVRTIGCGAFADCFNLNAIVLPKSVELIDTISFYLCAELDNVYYTGSEGQMKLISVKKDNDEFKAAKLTYNYVHSPQKHAAAKLYDTEPSCEFPGTRGGSCCVVCGAIITQPSIVPALGHDWDIQLAGYDPETGEPILDCECRRCYLHEYYYGATVVISGDTTVTAGKSIKLTADFLPDNLTDTSIVWSLSDADKAFASISASGSTVTLTAKKVTEAHTVTLTASAKDGLSASASVDITVVPLAASVDIWYGGELASGKTYTLDINNGQTGIAFSAKVAPDSADPAVTWTSSNTKLATVDENGVVTVMGTGKVTVTATTADGSKKTAKVTLNVIRAASEISILTPPETVQGGKAVTLKTDVQSDKTLTDKAVIWSLREEDAAYASISTGGKLTTKTVYTPVTVSVTAAVKARPEVSETVEITLLPACTAAYISSGGRLTDKTSILHCNIGGTLTLEGRCYPASAFGEGAWKSSSAKLATVENGLVTGVKAGTVTVTYSFGGKSASVKVIVGDPVTDISFTAQTDELRSGKSFTFKAVTNDGASVKKLTYSLKNAADAKLCTLSASGKLTAKTVYGEQSVTILAAATDGTGFTKECTVLLKPKTDDLLVIRAGEKVLNDSTVPLQIGEALSLDVKNALGGDETVTWKVSNAKAASVEGGVLTALANGTVTVTATGTDKRTAKFTVKIAPRVSEITVSVKNNARPCVIGGKSITLLAATNADAANKKVTWALADGAYSAYCTLSASGVLKALAVTEPVKVYVIASAADGSGVSSEPFEVSLYPAATAVSVFLSGRAVTGLTVNSGESSLKLSAAVYPSDAQQEVIWKSSSTKIASIDEDGSVTVLKAGKVTFTATAADGSAKSAKVTFVFG